MWDVKSNAAASSSKLPSSKPPKKLKRSVAAPLQLDIKTLQSVKAELADDEFDEGVRQDAALYSASQKWKRTQEDHRAANRTLRAAGQKPIKAPPKPKFLLPNTVEQEDWDSDGGNNTHYVDPGRVRDWDTFDKKKLPMEGLVILPGSPLHRLAGLPEPKGKNEVPPITKIDPWSLDFDRKPGKTPKTERDKTLINGTLVKKEWLKLKDEPDVKPLVESSVELDEEAIMGLIGAQEGSDDEEMAYAEEDDDDDDDDIVVAPTPTISARGADEVNIKAAVAEDDDEDYDYGDDEDDNDVIIAPTVPIAQSQSQVVGENETIEPGCRPAFPITIEQALMGPLILDPKDQSIAVPASINRFLRPYQQEGVRFFWKQYSQGKGGILGDDMGLGKTIQVISFLSAIMGKTGTVADENRRKLLFRRDGPLDPLKWPTALIIVPASLVDNWARELDTWGYFEYAILSGASKEQLVRSFNRGQHDIVISSYETLRDHVDMIKDLPWSTVIFDEAHRLKNPMAALTLAAKKIHCLRAFGLTGTLIQNRLEEMWSVLDYAARGQVGIRKQWKNFIVKPIKIGHRLDTAIGPMVESIMRLYQLKNRILPEFYLRRDKRLITHELPVKRDVAIFCPLAPDQIIAYKAILESEDCKFVLNRNLSCPCGSKKARKKCCFKKTEDGRELRDVIFPIMHGLGKTANHVALLLPSQDSKTKVSRADRDQVEMCTRAGLPLASQSALEAGWCANYCGKWKILQALLQDWRTEGAQNKILIFSNSVRLLRIVHDFIQMRLKYNCLLLIGEVPPSERLPMVDAFQNPELDNYIFLISTTAGGVGLNLTAANKVVILDPNWNPANDLQAMDRAFRIGQKRAVDVYRMIGEGTIEEIMYERQVHKQIRSKQINDGTFEARVHVGYDGAVSKEAQGELFGIQNLFIYKEGGFMRSNLNRVKEAEDYFMAEAQGGFELDEADDEDFADADEDEVETMQANRKLAESLQRKQQEVVEELLEEDDGGSKKKKDAAVTDDVLKKLKIIASAHNHDSAFGDSAAERGIFEAGLELLRVNPAAANKIKAFEIGSKIAKQQLATAAAVKKPKEELGAWPPLERPAKGDAKRKRQLVELSDEE